MESILILTHIDETGCALTKASLEAVTAGLELASRLNVSLAIGIVAADPATAADSLAASGARLLAVSGEAFAQPRYATDATACEALCRATNASIVLVPAGARFARERALLNFVHVTSASAGPACGPVVRSVGWRNGLAVRGRMRLGLRVRGPSLA